MFNREILKKLDAKDYKLRNLSKNLNWAKKIILNGNTE
jgi:hypothetical protein